MPDSSPLGMRIVVVGSTGSGKSTLAATLAERLDLPFVELDALFWQPGWVESDDETFRAKLAEATAGDGWVVAGNYQRVSSGTVWPRAETMIVLDVSLMTKLRRIFLRSWRRSRTRKLLWGTNYERFWPQLYRRDSLLLFAIRTHRSTRRRYRSMMSAPEWSHLNFVHHHTPSETARWLARTVPLLDARSGSGP